MEAALALLLPLIGGSLFVRGCTGLRYKAAREDGHRLYFRVAYHGVVLFVVSTACLLAVDWALGNFGFYRAAIEMAVARLAPLFKEPRNAGGQSAFLAICLFSVLLGRVSPLLVNVIFKTRQEDALWAAASENELEEFLLDALARLKSVAITLTSGKVYVGYVLTTPEPRTDRRVIALLPLMSGYRQEAGGKVVFTTYYDQFYRGENDLGTDDFKLVLPIDKMVSLSFFDVAVYARFNEEGTPLPRPRRVKVGSSWRGRHSAIGKV